MTIGGALSDLNNLLNADDIPCYYKPSIKAVIDTIALEQESCDDVVALDFSADIDEPNKYQTKDGKWHEGRIPMQQPCEDCISRAEALRHSHIEYDDDGEGHRVVYVEDIEELPSVTPKGVTITDFADRCRECGKQKVGKWEELGIVMEGRMYEHGECDMQDAWGCDYCDYQVYMPTNYCPNCGAKMEVDG